MTSLLRQALADILEPAPLPPSAPAEVPPDDPAISRGLVVRSGAWRGMREQPQLEPDEAMAALEAAGWQHLSQKRPHVLAVAAPAGLGKTTLGVRWAEKAAAAGLKVLYLGPRRNFFADILAIAQHPSWWYEWKPRQAGDEEAGKLETCKHTRAMTLWLDRGYDAMSLCSNPRICGWDYVNAGVEDVRNGVALEACTGCRYHAQRGTSARIIYGHHQHLMLGHPMLSQIDIIIGDESPLEAVARPWVIPGQHIAPADMDLTDPFTEVVHQMAALASSRDGKLRKSLAGPELLDALGGPHHVLAACNEWALRADAKALTPTVRNPLDVDEAPYFHLLELARLLQREAASAASDQPYPHRVIVDGGNLTLLLRRRVNVDALGKPVVWLDATASDAIYEQMFHPMPVEVLRPNVKRAGRIVQLWQRSNHKTAFIEQSAPDKRVSASAPRLAETNALIDQIVTRGRDVLGAGSGAYERPALISYKAVVPHLGRPDWPRTWFGGARGTNALEGCDCLIVVGTPLPAVGDIETVARMLWWERMDPFNPTWRDRLAVYPTRGTWRGGRFHPGKGDDGAAMLVSGFWDDPDLSNLLWQYREAELNQAANRARPLRRKTDVWVLSSVPISGVAPDVLLSMADLMTAPEPTRSADGNQWPEILAYARRQADERGSVTATDIAREFGLSNATASRYVRLIAQQAGWQLEAAARPTGGRPGLGVRRCD